MNNELHPLCTLFPRLTGQEFEALRDDIKAHGLRSPIVLHQGMILDGGNRYRACLDAGVKPHFVEFDGESIGAFVASVNLHRRHMTPGQRAAIVASIQDWAKTQPRGGDRKSDQSAMLHFDSVAARKAVSGASERTQKMADKVARADPALTLRVAHGELSLPKALERIEPAKPERGARQIQVNQESTAADEVTALHAEIAALRDKNDELARHLEAVMADLESALKVAESDNKAATALREAKQYREQVRVLTERVAGLQSDKNEAIKMVKSLQRTAAGKVAA